ncbi:MAG: glycosyltransferase family 2 protein [bacterium]|nr:glycosyltransferase family 2 protein [bacterium]
MTPLSIIIPVKDEEQSLPVLYKELLSVFGQQENVEMIFVDDGSIDDSYDVLKSLQKKDKRITIIKFRGNFGKSAALNAGFAKAKHETIAMMDADLQDDPSEIPKLLQILQDGYDLVSGWRRKRSDSPVKRMSSYFFNRGTVFITGVRLHDFNCGLKVMKKKIAQSLNLHGELHRFIPILAAKMKFKVTEVEVIHRKRRFGTSKFGLERSWRGMLDLLTIIFISDYATKPAHFFGRVGLLLVLVGGAFDGYVTFLKITTGSTQDKIPLFLAGMLFIVVGVQLLSTGLIAEMVAHYLSRDNAGQKDLDKYL